MNCKASITVVYEQADLPKTPITSSGYGIPEFNVPLNTGSGKFCCSVVANRTVQSLQQSRA